MSVGDRRDPYLGFNFRVQIEGIEMAGFSEVTGLQAEVEVQEYREGGSNLYVHRLAGPARFPNNLILKHGLMDIELWEWHLQVLKGDFRRRNGSIVLLDPVGEETWRWNLYAAYPMRWSGPELRAGASEVAVETLELIYRWFEVKVK